MRGFNRSPRGTDETCVRYFSGLDQAGSLHKLSKRLKAPEISANLKTEIEKGGGRTSISWRISATTREAK
jgi:hypothetical protein